MPSRRTFDSLPINQIEPSPFQVRRDFSPAKIEALAASIRELGLIDPILVRPKPLTSDSGAPVRYQIVCGERRFRAVKLLGWTEIPAQIEEMSDAEALIRGVAENESRADTNVIEKALGYRAMMEPPATLSQAEVSDRVGVSQATVSRRSALLQQPQEIQDLLISEQLSEFQVISLTPIESIPERISMARKAAASHWSAEEISRRLGKKPSRKGNRASDKVEMAEYNGFRLKLVGEEIVHSGRNFKLTEIARDYGAQLADAIDNFLLYHMPTELMAVGRNVPPGASREEVIAAIRKEVAAKSSSSPQLSAQPLPLTTPGFAEATTPTVTESSAKPSDPAQPLLPTTATSSAAASEEDNQVVQDWATQLKKGIGPAGELLAEISRAAERAKQDDASLNLGKIWDIFKRPKK